MKRSNNTTITESAAKLNTSNSMQRSQRMARLGLTGFFAISQRA